jgi:hypothetical protein
MAAAVSVVALCLTSGAGLSVAQQRENEFFHFEKMLLSAETCLIHSKIIRASKIMKIVCSF